MGTPELQRQRFRHALSAAAVTLCCCHLCRLGCLSCTL